MDSQPQGDQRLVKFKQLDGSIIEVTVPKDILISDLKSKIKDQAKLSEDQIRFIFKAKSLNENQKLSEVVTEDGQTIHLVKKAAPQPASQPASAGASAQPGQGPAGVPQGMPPGMAAMFGQMGGAPGLRVGGPPPHLAAMLGQMGAGQPGARAGGPPPNLAAMLGQMGAGQPGARAGGPPPNLAAMLGGMRAGPPGGRAGGPPPNLAAMLGQMGAGQPGAAGGPPGQPPLDLQNIMNMANQIVGQMQVPQPPASAQQQPPAQAPPASSGPNSQTAIQLPHQVLFRVGQMCNHMYGGNFPGPSMPQLQVDRNLSVLLGSYLCNLNMQLQRLSPLMQRCGDLMQREAQITNQAERKMTEELAGNIGKCLEDISRATGSVAHLYKTVELGNNGAATRCKAAEFDQVFAKIIEEVGSIQSRANASQPEEAKGQETKIDILKEVEEKVNKQDMVKLFQGKHEELNHLVPLMYDTLETQVKRLGSNEKVAEEYSNALMAKLNNDEVKDCMHEGFDPIVNCDDVIKKYVVKTIELSKSIGRSAPMTDLIEPFKKLMHEFIFSIVDETKEGFKNDEDDVMKWFKSNLSRINLEGVPENMKMMANMKTAMMCGNVQGLLNRRKAAAQPQPAPAQPTPASATQGAPSEESKVDQTEQQRMQLKRKYEAVIKADKEKMTQTQGPLSRAYLSTSSFAKSSILSKEEEKISTQDYHTDKKKKLDALKAEPKVRDAIRRNLITGGGFPQAKVESVMQNIPTLPDELVEAYLKMQKSTIKYRLVDDEDFQAAQKSGDAIKKEQFKNLTNL